MEIASLGALFLLAVFVPAYASDPKLAEAFASGKDPGLVALLGIGSTAGVGALLSLVGAAVWDFLWPYSPRGGWVPVRRLLKFLPESPSKFREGISDGLPCYDRDKPEELVWNTEWDEGERAVVRTAFLLYGSAPAEVREWIRRRYARFSTALSADAAFLLGLVGAFWPFWSMNLARAALTAGFLVVVVIAFVDGRRCRREAIAMETYWFAVRDRKPKSEITKVAFEPNAELIVRPTLRLPFVDARATEAIANRGNGGNAPGR